MASETEITRIRRLINDVDEPQSYSDNELSARFSENDSDYNKTAYSIWVEKAASYSTMVNTSESGSSRNMGDLYSNALKQVQFFKGLIDESEVTADSAPFTVQSVRD